jgi:hypothetical protein
MPLTAIALKDTLSMKMELVLLVVSNVKPVVETNTIVILVQMKENNLQVPVHVQKDNTKLMNFVMIVVIDVVPVLTLTTNVTPVLTKPEVLPNNAHVNQVTSTMDSKLNVHHVHLHV